MKNKRTIRKKVISKLKKMDDNISVTTYEYNKLMNYSVEEITKLLKEHNKQYLNGSKKRYQVLYLMKLNKEKKTNEITINSLN